MKIHDDHLYHGAALIQIAEHPNFTAINALKLAGNVIRVGYKVNDDIAVYFKYASNPTKTHKEYVFTFTKTHRSELFAINKNNAKLFVVLVCVKDREICCLTHDQLDELLKRREAALGHAADDLTVLVTVPKGKGLRVYVNTPGKRNAILGNPIIISRNSYPQDIFE